jgi:DNA-binding GntR family transcriptional regulator
MQDKVVTSIKGGADTPLLGESTYLQVRQAILSCSLEPGSMLTEASVMERYAVSRSTCRLALVRLAQEGLVRSVPRHGYMIVPVTLKDLEEVFALRLLLEPEAARLAAGKVGAGALMRIDRASRTNTASLNKGNRIGFFLDANREFHLAIAMASGNDRLVRNISVLLDEMKRFVALGFASKDDTPEIAGDHLLLVEALQADDGRAAERLARRHIEKFRDMTMDKVLQSLKQSHALTPLRAGASTSARSR